MFCRVLDNPQRPKAAGSRGYMDNQVIERVKELEQRSLLTATQTNLANISGEEIEKLALLDGLTELYNSRTFNKEIRDELKRAKRYKRPVSLVLISVDGFKDIQRTYGALTADAVLKVVGGVLKGVVRDVDIPARYSLEEFAIILPETNASGALIVAERIRSRMSTHGISHNWHNLKVTASIGLAAFPTHARESEELLSCCNQALGSAIERGGDQVATA